MLERGLILSDRYRLETEIGRGGMGSVWRATRLDLGTNVAVKLMHADASAEPGRLTRFTREAKAAARLSSPHVVRILDFGVDPVTSHAFIAMELLEGECLATRLGREGTLPPIRVASIITQVSRALSEAHATGIIHRDLKPENIFLVKNQDDELVKLLDFGIAKADGDGLATSTGSVMGTPYYMSPEQVNSLKDIDHRTDLWSLAVIACECMTGRRPFDADTLQELAMKIVLGRADAPSALAPVPAGFDTWFAQATQVDPARRFQSATELASTLNVLAGEGLASRPGNADRGRGLTAATLPWGSSRSVANGSPARAPRANGGERRGRTTQSTTGAIPRARLGEKRAARVWVLAVAGSALIGAGALAGARSRLFDGHSERVASSEGDSPAPPPSRAQSEGSQAHEPAGTELAPAERRPGDNEGVRGAPAGVNLSRSAALEHGPAEREVVAASGTQASLEPARALDSRRVQAALENSRRVQRAERGAVRSKGAASRSTPPKARERPLDVLDAYDLQ